MLGAGYLGARCLRDASRASWALQASEGLARAGRPPLCGPASQVRVGGRPHLQVTCVFPELLCPSSPGSHSPQQGSQGEAEEGRSCIRKRVHQGCILSPCLFNFYVEYISKMLGWMKPKLESSLPGEISITTDMQMTPHYGRKWRWTKEPLDKGETGEWKSWLKTQHSKNEDYDIWSYHFIANRWGNNGNSERPLFSLAPKSVQMVTAAMKLKDSCSLDKKLWPT